MKFHKTRIADVKIIEPVKYRDERGYFMEVFDDLAFRRNCGDFKFVKDNQSLSVGNVLRGMHYQTRHCQGKLIRVIKGAIYDVVVDMRMGSPSLGEWVGCVLSADNQCQLWVPPGFAHGFYVSSTDAEVVYKCTDIYDPSSEVIVDWQDPSLGIDWPIPLGTEPLTSAKDACGVSFMAAPKLSL